MDQTPSQLPDTAQLIDALRSALKEHSQKPTETQDAQLRDTVEQFLRLLPGPAGPPPRQALRTVVDNSKAAARRVRLRPLLSKSPYLSGLCCRRWFCQLP
jgi:hypothetical protein